MMRRVAALLWLAMPIAVVADMDAARKAVEQGEFGRAVELFEDEAVRANVEAAYELALLYRDGKGVKVDPERAFAWMTEAAETDWIREPNKFGLPQAQYELARMYLEGVGTEPDPDEAVYWLERAVSQGHAGAALRLAQLYLKGGRIDADPISAYVWASFAAERLWGEEGDEAARIRDEARRKLNAEALGEARHRLADLNP